MRSPRITAKLYSGRGRGRKMAKMPVSRSSKAEGRAAKLHEPGEVPPELARVHRLMRRVAKSSVLRVRRELEKMLIHRSLAP